jgi:predicted phage-related endonuclease
VFGEQTTCQHPIFNYARATVDAFYAEVPTGSDPTHDGILEIKTTSAYSWDDVPDYYALQVQWQMEVCDINNAIVAALHNGRKLTLWPIERDKELGASLLDVAGRFWEHNVLGMNPPDVDGTTATTEALARMFPAAEPGTAVDVTDLAAVLTGLEELRGTMKQLDRNTSYQSHQGTVRRRRGRDHWGTTRRHVAQHVDQAFQRNPVP